MNRLIIALVCAFLLAQANGASAARGKSPEESLRDAGRDIAFGYERIRPLRESDPDRFFQEFAQVVNPWIAIGRFARGIMGKHGDAATPDQRDRLRAKLERPLMQELAKYLDRYPIARIKPGTGRPPTSRSALAHVDVELQDESGDVVPVRVDMIQSSRGVWRIANVTIANLDVDLSIRGNFEAAMGASGGNLDRAIDRFRVRLPDAGFALVTAGAGISLVVTLVFSLIGMAGLALAVVAILAFVAERFGGRGT